MPTDPLTTAQARLNAARSRKRRAALGPALSVDDASLDTLATVYPADLIGVEAMIRDAAGQTGVDLFRATPEGLDRQPPGRV